MAWNPELNAQIQFKKQRVESWWYSEWEVASCWEQMRTQTSMQTFGIGWGFKEEY